MWNPSEYTPNALMRRDPKELRSEYVRLRNVARKRLDRIEKSKDVTPWTETDVYRAYGAAGIPALPSLTPEQLPYQLAKLARWVENPQSKIGELKKRRTKSIKTLHEHGYDFVNKENFLSFGRFMEYYRQQGLDKIYGSPDAADVFEAAEDKNIDIEEIKEQFEDFLENVDEFRKMDPIKTRSGKPATAKQYKAKLTRKGKWRVSKSGSKKRTRRKKT